MQVEIMSETKLRPHSQSSVEDNGSNPHGFDYPAVVEQALADHGISEAVAQSLRALDSEMFQLRRRMKKHEFARHALAELELDLEHAQFEALIVIAHIAFGYGDLPPRAATVGAIAEEMVIDPSRASRLASDLVSKGFARRAAVQEDGRKSCLELTEAGQAVLHAVIGYKWRRMAALYKGWTTQELDQFAQLLAKLNRAQPG